MSKAPVIFLVCILSPAAAWAGELTVKVDHVRNDRGAILAALYDSETSFMQQPLARATFKLKATPGEVSYVFHDLPPGKYALAAFHDENDNGRLDKNLLGIPKEGYGFSNSSASLGPPRFSQAAFEFNGTTQTITITLHY
jgi:uncharacterized protein (DUF2141 family)